MDRKLRAAVIALRHRVTVLQTFMLAFRGRSPAAGYGIGLADEVHEALEEVERLLNAETG